MYIYFLSHLIMPQCAQYISLYYTICIYIYINIIMKECIFIEYINDIIQYRIHIIWISMGT